MVENGIEIYWDNATEFIQIDFEHLDELNKIKQTIEYWDEKGVYVVYDVAATVEIKNDYYELCLHYDPERNQHLNPQDVCWGISTIKIDNSSNGTAIWKDSNDPENNGEVDWKKVDKPLIGNRRKATVEQNIRAQTVFRKSLLDLDKQCVISHEVMPEVLEAAHIIPVSQNGLESVNNGILLRSDIHKLYDANKFEITDKGEIEITGKLSKQYIELLQSSVIPNQTLLRVKNALKNK